MNNILFSISLLLLGCAGDTQPEKPTYLRWVGDIEFNADLDNTDFNLCFDERNVKQYFNFSKGMKYVGEKPALTNKFKTQYKPVNTNQSGTIRIRFIVNCKGETGRFRVIGMDEDYNEFNFDQRIVDQLVDIAANLTGWGLLPDNQEPLDYYQYLIFKIDNGNITEILP